MSWQDRITQRLRGSVRADGGWGYQSRLASSAEPTALACLALWDRGFHDEVRSAARWLAARQQKSGAVQLCPEIAEPNWPTGLAMLAWLQYGNESPNEFKIHVEQGAKWLLSVEGKPFRSNPAIYGHDTRLIGWPWVHGTHTWIEPTTHAVFALRAAGLGHHDRVLQAMAVLRDRAISGGGWNYGNSRMFGSDLRPFPAQTGMALAALTCEPRTAEIDRGLVYLRSELSRIRAPFSLAWGLIGLTAWNERPEEAETWLEECADRLEKSGSFPAFDAMLLLVDGVRNPFLTCTAEVVHGA